MFHPDKPYNELPYLPPKADLETKTILKKIVIAREKLAELRGYAELLPNKNIILNTLILQESKDSSEIENIITTQDELYQAAVSEKTSKNPAVKEVLNYRSALYKGLNLIRNNKILTVNMIADIQKELEQNDAGIRKLPGTKLVNDKTGEVLYTPPDNETNIRNLLSNLEQFINEEDNELDPLVKMAVAHYQFESIHPFYDGNGRTGRIINVLYLILKGLLLEPLLYMSRYIIQNKPAYYHLLRQVTFNNNWESWILFMLEAVERTAVHTLTLSRDIIALMEKTGEKIRLKKPKIYSREFLELLFTNVYTKIGHLTESGIASRNIASSYLNGLEEIGILQNFKIGRETLYINFNLFDLLKNFNMH